MSGLIRSMAALAVLAVATIAAVISFGHIETLALVDGQSLLAARLLPASVDGTVLAASMVLLDAARRGVPAPALARVMLAAGVLATLGANADFGAAHGVVGILVSMWPAIAFLGSAEVFLSMARVRSRSVPGGAREPAPEALSQGTWTGPEVADGYAFEHTSEGVPGPVPESVPAALTATGQALPPSPSGTAGVHPVAALFAADLERGEVPSIRQIKRTCKVGQSRAEQIRDELAVLAGTTQVRVPGPVPEPA